MSKEKVEIEVAGGICRIIFSPWVSTGAHGSDTSPGVGFHLIAEAPAMQRDDKFYMGTGVIGRKDAMRLRDMLEMFLKNHTAGIVD